MCGWVGAVVVFAIQPSYYSFHRQHIKRSAASAVDQIDVSFLSAEAQALLKDIREADIAKISDFPFNEQQAKQLFR